MKHFFTKQNGGCCGTCKRDRKFCADCKRTHFVKIQRECRKTRRRRKGLE